MPLQSKLQDNLTENLNSEYLTKEYSNFSRGRVEMALRGTQGRGKLQGVEFIVPELWEGADAVPLSPPLLSPVFLSLISPALLHPLPFRSLVQTQSLVQAMQVTQALTMPSIQPSSFFLKSISCTSQIDHQRASEFNFSID